MNQATQHELGDRHQHHRPTSFAPPPALGRLETLGLVFGGLGLVGLLAGYFLADGTFFFRAYLMGWVYWVGVAAGSMALLMIQHLSGGAWGVMARRIFEAAAKTLPWLALGFIPLVLGRGEIYPWAMEAFHEDHLIHHREGYLNGLGWIVRGAAFLAIWSLLAWRLTSLSARQDETGDPDLIAKMKFWSAPGLVVYAFTATFASFDWFMSMDKVWYSTIYGVWFFGGHGLSALAFTILIALFLVKRKPMAEAYQRGHFHDWGKLLLAMTMLWAYFSLSQFLITWSGNVPEFVTWYLDRLEPDTFRLVGLSLAILHFALPFLLLLSRDLKRDARLLGGVALLLLAMHWVDYSWNVVPATTVPEGGTHAVHATADDHGDELDHAGAADADIVQVESEGVYGYETTSPEGDEYDTAATGHGPEVDTSYRRYHWLDPVAVIAWGGLFLWLFVRQLRKRPLVPINDPYLEEALHGGSH